MPWFPASPIWVSSSIRWGWPCSIPIRKAPCPSGRLSARGLLLLGISLAVLACRRKCPYLLGRLAVVSGNARAGDRPGAGRFPGDGRPLHLLDADRAVYRPGVGNRERVCRGSACRRWAGAATAAVAVAALACCAWQQASYWKDEETVWTHALACTSRNFLAHASLGALMAQRGQIDEAISHFEDALSFRPDYAEVHTNLGLALAARGQIKEAIDHYQTAMKVRPEATRRPSTAWRGFAPRIRTPNSATAARR